jgi:hypothetical protein
MLYNPFIRSIMIRHWCSLCACVCTRTGALTAHTALNSLITGQRGIEKRKVVLTSNPVNAVRTLAISPNLQPNKSMAPGEVAESLGTISRRSVYRVLQQDLGMKAARRVSAHHLTGAQKENRARRCREWRLARARNVLTHRQYIYMDEKARMRCLF